MESLRQETKPGERMRKTGDADNLSMRAPRASNATTRTPKVVVATHIFVC